MSVDNVFDFDIDGMPCKVCKLPGRLSLEVFHRLVKMVGQPVVQALASLDGSLGTQLDMVIPAVIAAVTQVEYKDLMWLRSKLLDTALVDNKPIGQDIHFDIVFQGRMDLFFRVLFEALRFNYAPLYDGLKNALSSMQVQPSVQNAVLMNTSKGNG